MPAGQLEGSQTFKIEPEALEPSASTSFPLQCLGGRFAGPVLWASHTGAYVSLVNGRDMGFNSYRIEPCAVSSQAALQGLSTGPLRHLGLKNAPHLAHISDLLEDFFSIRDQLAASAAAAAVSL